jgi:hypothetical protein
VSMSTVRESTMGSPTVEGCIAQKLRSLVFPQPKSVVVVNYPFVFKSSTP